MLRISVLNDPGTARLKLEGKLAHEWVSEAEKAWLALLEMDGSTRVVVDLAGVSFVDDLGCQLLAAMRHKGAELVGSGLVMTSLIEEIEVAEIEEAESEQGEEESECDWLLHKNGDQLGK
jgi:anti-anti-sigma regulatory factor